MQSKELLGPQLGENKVGVCVDNAEVGEKNSRFGFG